MDFLGAMNLLIQGKCVRKKSWDDKTEHVFMDMDIKHFFCVWDNGEYSQGFNDLHTFSCATGDKIESLVFTDSWEEYQEEPKLYSFEEALKALKNWKSIVRKGGNAQYRMNNNREICILKESVISNARFSSDSVLANDWMILEDGEAK